MIDPLIRIAQSCGHIREVSRAKTKVSKCWKKPKRWREDVENGVCWLSMGYWWIGSCVSGGCVEMKSEFKVDTVADANTARKRTPSAMTRSETWAIRAIMVFDWMVLAVRDR